MLRFIFILSLGFFYVMGAPQLKLDHAGYEIISINDRTPDSFEPSASKDTLERSSRYDGIDVLNLEKASDFIDEDEELSPSLKEHKRHYEPNTIEDTDKQSFNQKSNIYLTLGFPKSFSQSTATRTEHQSTSPIFEKSNQAPQLRGSTEDSDSHEESRNEENFIVKSKFSRIDDRESNSDVKSSKQPGENKSVIMRNQGNNKMSSAMMESNFELADLKDDDKIRGLVVDAHHALSSSDAKADPQDTQDPPTVKSGFTMVTHFPSSQIHHQRASFGSRKEPATFSSIRSSGFDVLTGSLSKKSAVPAKDHHERQLQIDYKDTESKTNVEIELRDHNNQLLLGHKFKEIHPDLKKSEKFNKDKMSHRITSVLTLDNTNHELFDPKTENVMSLPISVTPLNVKILPFSKQQSLQSMGRRLAHLEMKPIPLMITSHFDYSVPTITHSRGNWEKIVPMSTNDFARKHQQDKDYFREYMDTNYVVHEVPPADSQETANNVTRRNRTKEGHETRDSSQPQSPKSKNSNKPMKTSIRKMYNIFLSQLTHDASSDLIEIMKNKHQDSNDARITYQLLETYQKLEKIKQSIYLKLFKNLLNK